MDIHILGGFLGSGKTTLLMKLVSMYSEIGKNVAIIVNEAGSVGVLAGEEQEDAGFVYPVGEDFREIRTCGDALFVYETIETSRCEGGVHLFGCFAVFPVVADENVVVHDANIKKIMESSCNAG